MRVMVPGSGVTTSSHTLVVHERLTLQLLLALIVPSVYTTSDSVVPERSPFQPRGPKITTIRRLRRGLVVLELGMSLFDERVTQALPAALDLVKDNEKPSFL